MEVTDDVDAAFATLTTTTLVVLVAVWFISATVAAMIAEHRGRSIAAFFFVTFFFLGPLGPGFALIAPREFRGRPVPAGSNDVRPVAEGRRRFTCPRCGAANDVPDAETAYDCWQCAEHRAIRPV
ncbi:hypothetical protein AXK56_06555 [Tsukamurella pulmonis]|uniref:Uncharacterized protein n=1 Tax=Tsukamurella pulmonis TaxID=47312 RepID=A0A1H1CR48_9ACTN|nr:hypothetical protein [Tsukamurella pulmonis]KXO89815.1 hypothetical protein AXK56_06555 [Tsukamurella pulmonis]SDQ66026.1 hypothetical protein SAMN04489765_1308 [Tsukamurella pulmonis]SUP23374.1 Uncharacterised protein [Tsukamurella pulmonis]